MARGKKPGLKALLRQPKAAAGKTKQQPAKKQQLKSTLAEVQRHKLERLQEQLNDVQMSSIVRNTADEDMMVDVMEQSDERELKDDASSLKASNRAFGRHLKSAIAMADVVVEVLDARDPMGFRSKALEEAVLENGKKLVLLLNKIDLLPDMAIVQRWETILKRQAPVVVFRAMTTSSRSKQATVKFEKGKATSACKKQLKSGYSPLGAADLMSALSNYTRVSVDVAEEESSAANSDGHRSITVCIVGMPNVGKSSVINSLMRNTKCLKTGNMPGVTREAQTVKLTKNIKLVDTPGVVFDTDVSLVDQVLKGTLVDTNDALVHEAIDHLLEHPRKRIALFKYFGLPAVDVRPTVEQLLAEICDTRLLVLSGGRRDLAGAAQVVIQAWVNGMVDYYELPITAGSTAGKVEYVAVPSQELDLDNL